MPSIAPNSKVLVTGSNGYIGMWIVHSLLEKGYSVRAVVRSAEKGQPLQKRFRAHGNKLELAVVADMTKVRMPVHNERRSTLIHMIRKVRLTKQSKMLKVWYTPHRLSPSGSKIPPSRVSS